jgi:hypothetical protein
MNGLRAKFKEAATPDQRFRLIAMGHLDVEGELSNRMYWCAQLCGAHDPNLSELNRRGCLSYLRGSMPAAYYGRRWPSPVPTELLPKKKP